MTPKKEFSTSSGEVPVYFQKQHTRSLTFVTEAGATSSEKDEGSLSDQLLKHSKDSYRKSFPQNIDAASVSSEEDRKLPAIPNYARQEKRQTSPENRTQTKPSISNSSSMGVYSSDSAPIIRSVSEPFNVTPPSRRIESSSDSATQPIPRSKVSRNYSECARLFDDSQSSFYKAALEDLSESDVYPMANQNHSVEKDEQLARALSQQLGNYPITSVSKASVESKASSVPASDSYIEKDAQIAHDLLQHIDMYSAPSTLKAPVESDLSPLPAAGGHLEQDEELARALSQQLDNHPSSSALESKIDSDILSILASNDHLEKDARLAKELSNNLENPHPSEALDEEFARRLQTRDFPNASMNCDQDIALAFKLLEEVNSTVTDTSSDEALAQKLSLELNASKKEYSSNKMIPRQNHNEPELCPDQLQILEKIQQDNERKLVEQALRESALSDLPVFQDHRVETGAGISSQICNNSGQDYISSQEHAIREWAAVKGRRHSGPSETSSHQTVISDGDPQHHSSLRHNLTRAVRRYPSAPNVYQADPQMMHCTDNSSRGNTDDYLPSMRIIPGRQTSYENQRGPQTNTNQNQNYQRGRQQQDFMRSRANDLLRRGNDETRTAIEFGRSHVVICQGCRKRLHAPKYYSLVFCPNCDTISPGLGADQHTGTTRFSPSTKH